MENIRESIKSDIYKLNDSFYFEQLVGGDEFLCFEGSDVGIDLTKDGVFIHDLDKLISYTEPTLIEQIKDYLK